jgi:L-threonylcarbamoyladenylate synthase
VKHTRILEITDPIHQDAVIQEAAFALRSNQTVILPTETVYGLAANALSETAVQSIFVAKGRPQDNPLIVHIAHLDMLKQVIKLPISDDAQRLMQVFWPGPLTLVLAKSNNLAPSVSAGLSTVGVRMPDHPITLKIIEASGVPIAAPSANLSGRPSPTKAQHIIDDMRSRVDIILCADQSRVGLESTVLDMSQKPYTILRPGAITQEDLETVLSNVGFLSGNDYDIKPKSPGVKYGHYQPQAPMVMVEGKRSAVLKKIHELAHLAEKNHQSVVIICADEHLQDYSSFQTIALGPLSNPAIMAANLFNVLYQCDSQQTDFIISEAFEEKGIGIALMNRLKKACGHQIVTL